MSLVKAVQLYASLQLVYVTEADLPSARNNAGDFIHSVMNYSLETAAKPTIVVIFDRNFDREDKTQQLINQFQNFYSDKKWPHVYWTTVPLFNEANNLDTFTMSYRAERLKPTIAINEINLKITANPQIDPDKIARNAYDESFGSIPPSGESILKYVLDINRYYLELALDKVSVSKENIVSTQIQLLQKVISDCVNAAVNTVKDHECRNVHTVYRNIVTQLCATVPGFELSPMIGISAEIKNPAQFKQSFQQMIQSKERMQKEITLRESEFNHEAIKSCRSLITQRLGCQACCPGCGAKCSNTESGHQHHKSSYHIAMAFKGWRWMHNNTPTLELCYQEWLTGSLIVGGVTFTPRRKYYVDRVPEWLNDIDEKSKTADLRNENIPPIEQRRAWMAVRHEVIQRYGMIDLPSYNASHYPQVISSLPAGFTPTWKYT
ncbi:unnamed protein product [Rotaria sp. Silwood1]|nr:unnamed protein product [Rotaria sp. Silwood1]CAF1654687.1 unnamed protein product [Rotaria sp. Silwood1]